MENLKERDYVENTSVDGRVTVRWNLNKNHDISYNKCLRIFENLDNMEEC
jgi:hypothetical protein